MSDASSYEAASYIHGSSREVISSGESLKVLGFHFSRRPTVHAHIEALRKRFLQQYWILFHLRRAGFLEEELAKVYRMIILPTADYCAAVYLLLLLSAHSD